MKAKLSKHGGIFIEPEGKKEEKILKRIWLEGEIKLFCKALFLPKIPKKRKPYGLWLGNNKIGLSIPREK